jgi:hypothetical protein
VASSSSRRERAGLKWASLSEKTRDLGRPDHRVALSKLERGEREISVPELVGIAAALDLPPLALLFPNVLDEVEIFPGRPVRGIDALGWFAGTGEDAPRQSAGIEVALKLVTNERTLKIQRHNLFQAERAPEVLDMS